LPSFSLLLPEPAMSMRGEEVGGRLPPVVT